MNTVEYPQLARSGFAAVAHDLVLYRQRPHPEWPELRRATYLVSAADVATQRAGAKVQVPKRNEKGELLRDVFHRLAPGPAKAFADRHGYPFTVHIQNLDTAEIVNLTA